MNTEKESTAKSTEEFKFRRIIPLFGVVIRWWWRGGKNTTSISKVLWRVAACMTLWSIALILLSVWLGIFGNVDLKLANDPSGTFFHFQGFRKINWLAFPVFWPAMCGLLYLTWEAFKKAWKGIRDSGVLTEHGNPAGDKTIEAICRYLESLRKTALGPIILVAVVLVVLDASDVIQIYRQYPASGQLLRLYQDYGVPPEIKTNQVAAAGHGSANAVAKVAELNRPAQFGATSKSNSYELHGSPQLDFSVAWLIPTNAQMRFGTNTAFPKRFSNCQTSSIIFDIVVYLQELCMAVLGLLVLFQVCAQCLVFWFLPRITRFQNLKIQLQPDSPLREFGLESWNHALNNVYWIFSVCLLIPIASRYSQADGQQDIGQRIFQILVPLLIAAPMLITIISRQQLLPEANRQVIGNDEIKNGKVPQKTLHPDPRRAAADAQKEKRIKSFQAQRLWPLDRHWDAKLGIVIAFLLLSYLLGVNILAATTGGAGH